VEFDKVTWNERNGRQVVADEIDAINGREGANFESAERVYRHLRRSYQAHLDFTRARDFYFGEMEMRRLSHQDWWRRWSTLTHLFWIVSGYGARWRRAVVWLLGMIATFALIYGFMDMQPGDAIIQSILVTVLRPAEFGSTAPPERWLAQALQLILSPVLITVLVLAVREQFRR
jgi:hypothetical protein